MIDFINIYMPAYVDLTQEELEDTRDRLSSFMLTGFPDMETSPASVTGDLLVTPQAYTVAALERGMDNFMSDLDLANVAAGTIYNCEFVEQYLGNFATDPGDTLKASGVARLVFSSNKAYTLDRSTRFSFNGNVFSMYMPYTGPYEIYPAGTRLPDTGNCAVLVDSGSGAWFVDIPLVGNSGISEVPAGTAGLVNKDDLKDLGAVTALVDFDSGEVSYTLPQLASLTRKTIYAASLNTRNGAIRYVSDMCPFIDSVYATRNGDREMARSYLQGGGCVDLYVRTKSYVFTEQQTVRLYKDGETGRFKGPFHYTGQIYHFESVTSDALAGVADIPHTITSTNTAGLGPLASYTVYEDLEIEVDDALDDNGDSLYDVSVDSDGRQYALFKLTYQTDPMFRAVHSMAGNPDNMPVNTSVLVRGFIPVVIDRFEVVYVKEDGVVPLLDEARDGIKAYMAALGAPDMYSDAEIARIMREAGARYMKGVNVQARVQWSVADRIQGFDGELHDVPQGPVIATSGGLRVTHPAGTPSGLPAYACSPRNVRYYFMEGALTFKEVKEM